MSNTLAQTINPFRLFDCGDYRNCSAFYGAPIVNERSEVVSDSSVAEYGGLYSEFEFFLVAIYFTIPRKQIAVPVTALTASASDTGLPPEVSNRSLESTDMRS